MKTLFCKCCFVILFVVCTLDALAQNDSLQIDSLKRVLLTQKEDSNKVNTLITLSNKLIIESDENALKYAREAVFLAGKIHFRSGLGEAYYLLGNIFYRQYNYAEAIKNTFNSLNIWNELKDSLYIASCHLNLGFSYMIQGNVPEALNRFYIALKVSEKIGDKESIARSFTAIAGTNYSQGNDSGALKNYLSSLEVSEDLSDTLAMGRSNYQIGLINFKMGNYSEAIKRDSAALKIGKQYGNKRTIADAKNNIGNIFQKRGELALASGDHKIAKMEFTEALKNYLESLKLYEEEDVKFGICNIYFDLGALYIKLKNFQEAKKNLEKCLQVSTEIGYNIKFKDIYKSFSTLDSLSGNYQQSLNHYKLYILYRDSLVNEENTKKSMQSKMQYDFEKKETVAQAKQDKKDAEQKRLKSQQYFAIGVLGILLLAVLFIAAMQWRNSKHKQKANLLLQQQKEKVESTLTELKATQAQLIQSEKMASLGELTAGIAHEI